MVTGSTVLDSAVTVLRQAFVFGVAVARAEEELGELASAREVLTLARELADLDEDGPIPDACELIWRWGIDAGKAAHIASTMCGTDDIDSTAWDLAGVIVSADFGSSDL